MTAFTADKSSGRFYLKLHRIDTTWGHVSGFPKPSRSQQRIRSEKWLDGHRNTSITVQYRHGKHIVSDTRTLVDGAVVSYNCDLSDGCTTETRVEKWHIFSRVESLDRYECSEHACERHHQSNSSRTTRLWQGRLSMCYHHRLLIDSKDNTLWGPHIVSHFGSSRWLGFLTHPPFPPLPPPPPPSPVFLHESDIII